MLPPPINNTHQLTLPLLSSSSVTAISNSTTYITIKQPKKHCLNSRALLNINSLSLSFSFAITLLQCLHLNLLLWNIWKYVCNETHHIKTCIWTRELNCVDSAKYELSLWVLHITSVHRSTAHHTPHHTNTKPLHLNVFPLCHYHLSLFVIGK